MTGAPGVAAIILAGGRATRLGGVDKPQLMVGDATLLDHALAAVSWCDPIVAVGPTAPVRAEVVWTQETPAFGGPAAGIAAGLALVESEEVCIVAADTPRAVEAVGLLRQHPSGAADGVCLGDAAGRPQWLIGRYRTAALRAAVRRLPHSGRDASIRALVGNLRLDIVTADALAADVDTWDDLERARAQAARTPGRTDQETT